MFAPFVDLGVVAAEEHVRHLQTAILGGFGVLGGLEEGGIGEGFLDGAHVIAKDSWQETNDGIDDDDGSDRAVGEDVVADGKLLIHAGLDDAVVDALVVAAEEDQTWHGGEAMGIGLAKAFALWGHKNDVGLGCADGVKGFKDGLGPQDHALTTAVRSVIDLAMTAEAVLAQVVSVEFQRTLLLCPAHDAGAERCGDELGEERDDVDANEGRAYWLLAEGFGNKGQIGGLGDGNADLLLDDLEGDGRLVTLQGLG